MECVVEMLSYSFINRSRTKYIYDFEFMQILKGNTYQVLQKFYKSLIYYITYNYKIIFHVELKWTKH